MTILVKLPNGQYGQFPDGTPHEQIESVLQKQFPPTNKAPESKSVPPPVNNQENDGVENRDKYIRESKGFKGLAAETLLNLSKAMESSVLFGRDLPKMLKETQEGEKERPLRPYLATAGGLAEAAKSAINAPHDLNQFLSRKLDFIPNDRGLIPHLPEDTGMAELTGLDVEQPEDRFYKGMANVLAMGAPSEIGALKAIEGGKAPTKVLPKHIEEQIAKQKKLLDVEKNRTEKFKNALEQNPEYGSSKANSLIRNSRELKNKIEEAKPLAEIPAQKVPEIPKAPDTVKMKQMAAQDIDQAKEAISKAFGEGKPHHTEGGAILSEEIGQVKNAASQQFKDTTEYFNKHDIKINNSEKVNKLKEQLGELESQYKYIKDYAAETPELVDLKRQIKALEKPKTINASSVLDTYQTLHKLANDAHQKIYERGSNLSKNDKAQLSNLATHYEELADSLGGVLEQVGDKNGLKMLKDAKKAWSEYASLYQNPTFRYLEKHKALSPSTLSNLELGTKGNELLNKIVEKRPDLRKSIFAQKYAAKANHNPLLRPNEAVEKHLNELAKSGELPEAKDLIDAFRNASETKKEVELSAKDLKEQHKELADSIKVIAEEQATRNKAIADIKKYTKLMENKDRAGKILEKRIKAERARGSNIKELEKQLAEINEKRARLKKLINKAFKLAYKYGGIKSAIGH